MAVRLIAPALLLWSLTASGAQYLIHGDYEIHYSAFPSLLIPADVASQHGIRRGENEVVINIAAMRAGEPARVSVEGTVTNLLNQQVSLDFEEVTEADAIYYLAGHTAAEEDTLRFSITVTPPALDAVVLEFVRRYD